MKGDHNISLGVGPPVHLVELSCFKEKVACVKMLLRESGYLRDSGLSFIPE